MFYEVRDRVSEIEKKKIKQEEVNDAENKKRTKKNRGKIFTPL